MLKKIQSQCNCDRAGVQVINGFLKLMLMRKDMWSQWIKFSLVLFVLTFVFISCKEDKCTREYDFEVRDSYLSKHVRDYMPIYKKCNDSINRWIKADLSLVKSVYFKKWQLDSVMIFNQDSTRFLGTVMKQSAFKSGEMDGFEEFAGAKIMGEWYFFFPGTSYPLPRKGLQYDMYDPFTFDELKYLSYDQNFRKLIKNIVSGKGNEEMFEKNFSKIGSCYRENELPLEECIHGRILDAISNKYNYKMSATEKEKIWKAIRESKRPNGIKIIEDERPCKPIFETLEWKTYLTSKSKSPAGL